MKHIHTHTETHKHEHAGKQNKVDYNEKMCDHITHTEHIVQSTQIHVPAL